MVERQHLEPALGEGIPPEDYDYGGISGGPMLYNVLTKEGLLVNALAGIVSLALTYPVIPMRPFPASSSSVPGLPFTSGRMAFWTATFGRRTAARLRGPLRRRARPLHVSINKVCRDPGLLKTCKLHVRTLQIHPMGCIFRGCPSPLGCP